MHERMVRGGKSISNPSSCVRYLGPVLVLCMLVVRLIYSCGITGQSVLLSHAGAGGR